MLGKPFLCSMIGTMFANFLALYLAAIKATCSIACILGLLFGVKVFVWGKCAGGRVVPEGIVFGCLVVGVLVCKGWVTVAYVVFLFCLSVCLLVLIISFRVGQDPLTATCCPPQLQHLMSLLQVEKK